MSLRRTILLACALVAAVPTAAQAAVTISRPNPTTLLVRSTGTEANDVQITTSGTQAWIGDANAVPVNATADCGSGSSGSPVECPVTPGTVIRVETGGGDDTIEASASELRVEAYGGDGADTIDLGDAGDLADGGAGVDDIRAGDGNDRIQARDGANDTIDCGPGDDDSAADPYEYGGTGCEIVAPWLQGQIVLRAGERYVAGELISPDIVGDSIASGGTRNIAPFVDTNRWYRCDARCEVVFSDPQTLSYQLTPADVGKTLYFERYVSNRAGEARLVTGQTPPIQAAPAALPPTGIVLPPAPSPQQLIAQWNDDLAGVLTASTAPLTRVRPSALAGRRSYRMTLALPWPAAMFTQKAQLAVVWTVPARTARKLGVKVRGNRAVTIASGSRRAIPAGIVGIDVRTTKDGRRILRRAKTLTLDVAASIKVDPRFTIAGIAASKRVTLKRR